MPNLADGTLSIRTICYPHMARCLGISMRKPGNHVHSIIGTGRIVLLAWSVLPMPAGTSD